jgi:hypothetical protein
MKACLATSLFALFTLFAPVSAQAQHDRALSARIMKQMEQEVRQGTTSQPTPPPGGCARWHWPARLSVAQHNGYGAVFFLRQSGSSLVGFAEHANRSSADGFFKDNKFVVTAYWSVNSIGVYEGSVNPQGRVEGITYDRLRPDIKVGFYSLDLLQCAVAAAPAAQPQPPASIPVTQDSSTLKAPRQHSTASSIRSNLGR